MWKLRLIYQTTFHRQWFSIPVCHFGIYSQGIFKIFAEYQSPFVYNAKAMLRRHNESWNEPVIFYIDISAIWHTTVWKQYYRYTLMGHHKSLNNMLLSNNIVSPGKGDQSPLEYI